MAKGQALVVILLILAVALTVGLAIVSRSITEVSLSTTEEESARALAAAEAGIEAALAAIVASGETRSVGTAGATYTVSTIPYGGGGEVAISDALVAGEAATVWLSGHDSSGNLVPGQNKYTADAVRVCWGQGVLGNEAAAPAVEVMLYYQTSGGEAQVGRAAYDPHNSRRASNRFGPAEANAGSCPADRSYSFTKNIPLSGGTLNLPSAATPLFLRLRLLYNGDTSHYVAVKAAGNAVFPVQGTNIVSAGRAGSTSRRVQVFERFPDLSPLFDSALFSGAGLTK